MFSFLRKQKKTKQKPVQRKSKNNDLREIKHLLQKVSTKDDVARVRREVVSSRKAVIDHVESLPDSLSSTLADQITSPLKTWLEQELSSHQAVKQQEVKRLSSNQAVSLDEIVVGMKQKVDMLTPRHLKILTVLAQNREEWLAYDGVGSLCTPPLSGSCIRGYVADLIKVFQIPIEKKSFGRQNRVRLSSDTIKKLAITKLID